MAGITGIRGKSPIAYPTSAGRGGGGGAPACTSNNLTITGLYACAENDSNTASGQSSFAVGFGTTADGIASMSQGSLTNAVANASHAEGFISQAGAIADTFTMVAGGTLVTIAGDATLNYPFGTTNGNVTLTPTTPVAGPPAAAFVASCPVFDGVNTTFNLTAPIDGTTTEGTIRESNASLGAHAEGAFCKALGTFSRASGAGGIAPGALWQVQGDVSGQYGRLAVSSIATPGSGQSTYVMPVYASRLYCFSVTFVTVNSASGQRTYTVRDAMVSVDASRNATVLTDVQTLFQDPDVSGVTTSITVALQGEINLNIFFVIAAGSLTTATTIKWTEVQVTP